MISLFDKDNTTFTGNGNVVLTPTEGKIRMVAGGSYDLTMRHPMDPEGKWRHLIPGAVVRAPVPEEEIENAFAGLDADVYKVTTAGDLREEPTAPSTISYTAWSETTATQGGYSVGSKVTFGQKNYECTYMDSGSIVARVIPSQSAWWKEIPRTNPGSPVLVTLPVGTELYFVQDVDNTWYQMSTYYGIEGYVEKAKVTYDRHLTPSETKPRIITEQLLRITNATVDTKSRTVSVTAEHVSNDLTGVIVRDVSISQASPSLALTRITDSFMIPYQGTIATNLDSESNGTYTGDIKGKNGTYCLLDPDKGIVSTFDAALKRDNWDLFILKKTNTNRGFQLRRGKNILGVNWARKSDGMINRVVPVAKDAGGADLFLPEVWVDSPNISSYPVIRMEMLSMKEQVGKDKGTGDGSTWTEADLLTEMRTRAGERFSVDKIDQVITEVTVDFEMLGATVEHPEMKALESVLLYDTVTAIDETIGLDTQLTVTELEWDALKKKVTAIKISNAEDRGGRSVTGYNVQAKSIGWSKLTDEVQGDIINQVKDMIPEYTDPEAARPGLPNTVSQDGVVTKGQGQANKVWKTDGSGNPAWRDESGGGSSFDPNDLAETTTDPTDNDFTMQIGVTSYKLKFLRVWNYIKGKISSVLGLTVSSYGGKAATAGDADTVNGKTVGKNVPADAVFTDTWNANSKTVAGYVSAPGAVANKVWKTDGSGNPGWRDDADTPYNLPLAANGTRGGLQIGYTQSGKKYPVQLSSEKAYVEVPWTADGGNAATVNGKTVGKSVPSDAVFTDTWRPVVDNLTSTDTDKSLSANQGKVLNDTTVKLTGGQTVGGVKTFTSVPRMRNSATSPSIYFQGSDLSSEGARIYAYACETSDGKYGRPFFRFIEYSPSANGETRTDNYEAYRLPAVDAGRSDSETYDIMTTKTYSVVDNLSSTSPTRPLSANQGKELNDTKVSKTGDHITGELYRDDDDVDASKANNNVSSIHYPTTLSVQDKDQRILGRAECVVQPDGRIGFNMYARNYDTSGEQVGMARILIYVDKNGDAGYQVDQPAAFRSAIDAKAKQTAKSSPSTSGYAAAFIDSVSQNAEGVITATKKYAVNNMASKTYRGLTFTVDKLFNKYLVIHVSGTTSQALPTTWTDLVTWETSSGIGARDGTAAVAAGKNMYFKTTNNKVQIYTDSVGSGVDVNVTAII